MTEIINSKPFPVIIKNYLTDGWKVINYYSANREDVLFTAQTWKEAKDFYDAERAKRNSTPEP